jgi:hypothetical protein
MKEPYGEGPATHTGPESCAGVRKEAGEALTGVRTGRVLNRENARSLRGADALGAERKATPIASLEQEASGPRAVVDPLHVRNHLERTREIPRSPRPEGIGDASESPRT